jgi:RNA polymerase sigma-70 factor (ECF subfamily)
VETGLAELLVGDLDRGFDAVMRRFQDQIFAFALSMCGNRAEAEEVAQDAFVRAYRALAGYPPERRLELKLRPWLHRIALNVFRNRVRRRTLRVVSLEQAAGLADNGWGRPEESALRGHLRQVLLAALSELPDRQREAVVLRAVEGIPYAEASAVLGRPVGTLKSDVHRGLLALRGMLAQEVSA